MRCRWSGERRSARVCARGQSSMCRKALSARVKPIPAAASWRARRCIRIGCGSRRRIELVPPLGAGFIVHRSLAAAKGKNRRMSKNMYGLPNHIYLVLGGFKYTSDPNGLIANVLDEHAPALEFQRCMDEDAWLKLQAAHPSAGGITQLTGEALLAGAGTVSKAETAIEKGIDVARRQNAKSWELRGTTSLARLRRQQGRREEAVALLAPVHSWFTEGFDTADLKEAKTLLDKLTEPAIAAEG